MNVTSKDILGSVSCMGEPQQPRRYQLLNIMRIGKRYRPYQFKNLMKVKPERVACLLNELNDEGLVDRVLDNGLIYWERIK